MSDAAAAAAAAAAAGDGGGGGVAAAASRDTFTDLIYSVCARFLSLLARISFECRCLRRKQGRLRFYISFSITTNHIIIIYYRSAFVINIGPQRVCFRKFLFPELQTQQNRSKIVSTSGFAVMEPRMSPNGSEIRRWCTRGHADHTGSICCDS